MSSAAYPTVSGGTETQRTRRGLMLHDTLTFLLLTSITVALFGMTLLLFHSFATHRDDLAKRWADRGRIQLQQGQAAQAVSSLRAALSYAPDDYQSQLLLAQALADAGEIDQATNYFLNLWAARPGDGFLNLQLARLARLKGNRQDAVLYYRASIFGDWRGDGAIRRRDVRLELADYLIGLHDDAAARVELLIAAGNAPNTTPLNLLIADKLHAAGDQGDALTYYQRAIVDAPRNAQALESAGRILYAQGDYAKAHALLARALAAEPQVRDQDQPHRAELAEMARDAARLVELSLSRELPAGERARHILAAAKIAQTRLATCTARTGTLAASPLQELQTRWRAASEGPRRNALAENAAGQDTLTRLIFDTERDTAHQTAQGCGEPTGDDALLLKLAQQYGAAEQP